MAKKNDQSNIIQTTGLVIGPNLTRLIDIKKINNNELCLDYTLFCPEFKYEPAKIFDPHFIADLKRHPQKANQLYEDGIHELFGEQLYDMGFHNEELRRGLTFTFKSNPHETDAFGEPRLPQLLSVMPVEAKIEKYISYDSANSFDEENPDERLQTLRDFFNDHSDIIPPGKNRYGTKYNFQMIMAGMDNLAHTASRKIVFENKIEVINRIRRDDYKRDNFETYYSFINTQTALDHNVSDKCRPFLDVQEQSPALINTPAIMHFAQTGKNIFSSKQTNELAKVHHKQAQMNYRPRYQQR